MAKFRGAIVVDTEHCKGCSLCVVACPTKVIELNPDVNGKGYHYAYMKKSRSLYRLCELWSGMSRLCNHCL